MNSKKYLLLLFTIIGLQYVVNAQENKELFTIYLVRHSEKDVSPANRKNPPLTKCGEQRAKNLNKFLEKVNLDVIYSTNYIRTKNTAKPTADGKNMPIKIYNPRELTQFSKTLIDKKQDALVVGHSNTTGVLAGLLVGEKIKPFDESIYNRIYQVVIHKKTGRLHILNTSFSCDN
ncbi:phosphoglycerate mutase family protein [Tenacibaculum halocynthiae]|uniref:phosphoglycerate mutase family protein n=1 Tax=Tenacibaculum halocynthiae TaxID=1254437 RepID=UPI0026166641|nr:phosphoglycerate mutase family protein [uncultured Tenacibaculum sp.]